MTCSFDKTAQALAGAAVRGSRTERQKEALHDPTELIYYESSRLHLLQLAEKRRPSWLRACAGDVVRLIATGEIGGLLCMPGRQRGQPKALNQSPGRPLLYYAAILRRGQAIPVPCRTFPVLWSE